VGSLATSGERNLGTSGPLSCQKLCSIDNDFASGTGALQAAACLHLQTAAGHELAG
jgi:hypothetical protein